MMRAMRFFVSAPENVIASMLWEGISANCDFEKDVCTGVYGVYNILPVIEKNKQVCQTKHSIFQLDMISVAARNALVGAVMQDTERMTTQCCVQEGLHWVRGW